MKSLKLPNDSAPIFFDQKGSRGKVLNYLSIASAALFTIFLAIFVVSVLINPFLPQVKLKPFTALPQKEDTTLQIPEGPATTKRDKQLRDIARKVGIEKQKRDEQRKQNLAASEAFLATQPAPTPHANLGRPLAIGFFVNWDDSSYTSLKRNIKELDWLVPEWIRLSGDSNNPLVLDVNDQTAQNALKLIREQKPEMPILPLLQNYRNEQWDPKILTNAIADETARQDLIAALLKTCKENGFGGLTLDLEEIPAASQQNLFLFVQELHREFQKNNLIIAQAVPFDNPDWNYRAYSEVTDYLMLMAYDQHWETGEAGPVAGQGWFEKTLEKRMAELSAAKTIICFGNYGYNWPKGDEGVDISFQESMLAAKESLNSPTDIKFDPVSKNPYFSYQEEDGITHDVWFLDASTAYNQLSAAARYKPAGFALWRMGSEDPSLWNIFGADKTLTTDGLDSIKYSYDVDFQGTGEILQVKALPEDGIRNLNINSDGQIIDEAYTNYPSSYVMQRTGDKVGKIVLTFDDGPDPDYTPKILDILKQENVKATFFVIGENGQTNPDLVKRIVTDGHEIGNHSFTHPNLGEVPAAVTDLELNATQRLIESLTGRSTRLFRAPYFGDAEPRTPNEVEPTVLAQGLGYIIVGLHLDPDDWKLKNDDGTPRTADDLVSETLTQAAIRTPEERGSIVLLHDGGGNRSATVEALPRIIHELRAKGYEFTTIADLAGITPEQAMPTMPKDQSYLAMADAFVFYAASLWEWSVKWLFLLGIILGIARVAFIGAMAFVQYLRSRRRDETHFGQDYRPFVSVIVPAFNEEKVICRTIQSLLDSEYQDFEIIVVDDGSADDTVNIATAEFGNHEKVQIFRKENGGKAEALNYGWQRAKGEIIVALDADTLFTPQTMPALVSRFYDEEIGAVAGNAKVGNRLNIVTKWQALEYVTSQNFDRRAFSLLNCITVVPGSVGAWRRSAVEKAGGFSSDTLAEDQDLTIQVRKLGYKIGYEQNAIGLTEAPDSLRGLAKQRFRWGYGTLQCMWKHKNALLNPRYGTLGFIAMPNVWVFQVLFPLISPVMDLMFIWTFVSMGIGYLQHQKEYSPTNLSAVMFYYALFLAIDWLGALFAFMLEKTEQKSLLGWLLIQRFGYRQIMYWVMIKSVYYAIRGAVVGWGKLERKATVEAKV